MVSERVEAWLRRHPVVVDSLLTLLLLVPCVLPYQRRGGLVILVALGLVLPLAVRRRYPVLSASVILSTAFVQWLTCARRTSSSWRAMWACSRPSTRRPRTARGGPPARPSPPG